MRRIVTPGTCNGNDGADGRAGRTQRTHARRSRRAGGQHVVHEHGATSADEGRAPHDEGVFDLRHPDLSRLPCELRRAALAGQRPFDDSSPPSVTQSPRQQCSLVVTALGKTSRMQRHRHEHLGCRQGNATELLKHQLGQGLGQIGAVSILECPDRVG